jgi:hypothetical protein
MKPSLRLVLALSALVLISSGCVRHKMRSSDLAYAPNAPASVIIGYSEFGSPVYAETEAPAAAERMRIWRARLSIDVPDVEDAAARAAAIAEAHGGHIERKSDSGKSSASLQLRIPVAAFTNAIGSIESLGTVTSRHVSSEDVTETYVDTEARLKNRLLLRDRLRELLDQAVEIQDILAIEKELNRVQGDIDSMEARLKSLKGQVDMASLDLSFRRTEILGPLGYVVKGVFWTLGKLFVIRD